LLSHELKQDYQKSIQEAREQGRAEATSNLISAVETLSKESKKGLFQQIESTIQNTNHANSLASTRGYFVGIGYVQTIEKTLKENAKDLASGKVKVETTPRYKCLADYHKQRSSVILYH